MAYTGQPVGSTLYQATRVKVSDGKSVTVTIPENTTVEANQFYEFAGFFGAAMQSVATGSGETAEVVLNIEQAEYETDQIRAVNAFNPGEVVYFSAGELTTDAEPTELGDTLPRKAGRVTQAKDRNNVIWFILGPQV